ncbi:NAD(P)-dependent dehydrogenase, short-chain alcohol dehydrogenase family [Rhizobiales bacterium GAS113]|nr:NAD(P)-dependent dehydrogenase, short-chain alcohol dehydrogenase family [Rhizobiales bacterium GAS113]
MGSAADAYSHALLAAGAVCHVPYIDEQKVQRFPHRGNERVKLVAGRDLADESSVAQVFDGIDDLWASIHVAGGFAMSPLTETDKAGLMAMIDTNLVSCYLCCRAAVRAMARRGAGGRIVNVAARHALESRAGTGMTAYTVSKAGVAALTEALAQEVVGQGILVNAVAPSIMDTPQNRRAMPKANYDAWPKVEEVAATILFLASPENRVTRGAVVSAFGRS